jgi:ribosome-dependent ATPase
MSQAFSLYTELTVRQNLDLHARLCHLPAAAIAVINAPQMLILDEPTSGVDPVARDSFWQFLIVLARKDGVTVFISTHFMNEAERCDRISLMHAGRIPAQGSPESLKAARRASCLEEAFIGCLEEAEGLTVEGLSSDGLAAKVGTAAAGTPRMPLREDHSPFSMRRRWAYARREAMEIRRDTIRLVFALVGPILLMIAFGFGINFDVDHVPFAVLDSDRSQQSADYVSNLAGSLYFTERPPIAGPADLERRLRTGELTVALQIPPGFGLDVQAGRSPEVGIWLDGANPSYAETSKNYMENATKLYAATLANPGQDPEKRLHLVQVAERFRCNPEFKSIYSMVPGVIMLLLMLVPAIPFSGWLSPLSSLSGGARFLALIFPSTYFESISLGSFTK